MTNARSKIATLALVTGAGLVSAGCTGEAAPEAAKTAAALQENRPGEEDLIESFARNPPTPAALSAKLDRLTKGTLLLVRFEADRRLAGVTKIPLRLEKQGLTFRDDGEDGDERAGDDVFTARTNLAFESVEREHQRLFEYLVKNGGEKPEPVFAGREIVGQRSPVATMINKERVATRLSFTTQSAGLGGLPYPTSFLTGVDAARSLMITDLKVVEDPKRTYNPCTNVGKKNGKWTFGYLMRALAGAGNASTFTQHWLEHWLSDQVVNSFNVLARPTVQQIIDSWPKTLTGELDLDKAPFKLLAIVNRIDLAGNAGYSPTGEAEGRFVYQWMDPETCTEDATKPLVLILEYGVPNTSTCEDLRLWAWAWKVLGIFPVGSGFYNAALQALTERFAKANADPANPNGSALNQLRTNDFKLVPLAPTVKRWELREFRIQPAGSLDQVTVINNPDDITFNEFPGPPGPRALELGDWINANAADIVVDAHQVPLSFPFAPGGAFRSGGIISRVGDHWRAPNILPFAPFTVSDVRHHFSLNTCDGCHTGETDTRFTHVKAVASWGAVAPLSAFLTGIDPLTNLVRGPITDPADPLVSRSFNDLDRRKVALNAFAFAFCGPYYGADGELMSLPSGDEPTMPFPPLGHDPVNGAH